MIDGGRQEATARHESLARPWNPRSAETLVRLPPWSSNSATNCPATQGGSSHALLPKRREQRDQLLRLVWLGNVMIEPRAPGERLVELRTSAGNRDEYRLCARVALSQFPGHGVSVEFRHANVEQNGVGAKRLYLVNDVEAGM